MSKADLELLRPMLAVLPAREVSPGSAPVERLLWEATELARALESAAVRDRLRQIGVAATAVERLSAAAGALRAAQREWEETRDRGKSTATKDRERQARSLVQTLVATCRWNLRSNPAVLRALELFGRDDGRPSALVDDLETIASMVGHRPSAFEDDRSFDALEAALEARELAAAMRAERLSMAIDDDYRAALDLRDRAWSYLEDMLSGLREGLRYATRDLDPMVSSLSSYPTVGLESGWFSPSRPIVARA